MLNSYALRFRAYITTSIHTTATTTDRVTGEMHLSWLNWTWKYVFMGTPNDANVDWRIATSHQVLPPPYHGGVHWASPFEEAATNEGLRLLAGGLMEHIFCLGTMDLVASVYPIWTITLADIPVEPRPIWICHSYPSCKKPYIWGCSIVHSMAAKEKAQ